MRKFAKSGHPERKGLIFWMAKKISLLEALQKQLLNLLLRFPMEA
jgi:hypothetical protein